MPTFCVIGLNESYNRTFFNDPNDAIAHAEQLIDKAGCKNNKLAVVRVEHVVETVPVATRVRQPLRTDFIGA